MSGLIIVPAETSNAVLELNVNKKRSPGAGGGFQWSGAMFAVMFKNIKKRT